MIAGISLATLGFIVLAFAASQILGGFVNQFTGSTGMALVTMVFTSYAVAAYAATPWTIPFILVLLAPFLVVLVVGIIASILYVPLAKRGYLGRLRQWTYELDTTNREFMAGLELLDEETVAEVAQVSVDARDFEENVIEAAGLDDHEPPGLE